MVLAVRAQTACLLTWERRFKHFLYNRYKLYIALPLLELSPTKRMPVKDNFKKGVGFLSQIIWQHTL